MELRSLRHRSLSNVAFWYSARYNYFRAISTKLIVCICSFFLEDGQYEGPVFIHLLEHAGKAQSRIPFHWEPPGLTSLAVSQTTYLSILHVGNT